MARVRWKFLAVGLLCLATSGFAAEPAPANLGGALAGERYRVLVSTDIGGTDPDDFQSMVHLLLYADLLDLEGLISSPYGPGRKKDILDVIECYARDFPNLQRHSARYPTAGALRAIAMQGETEAAPYAGIRGATEGSRWIVQCARRADPRPLFVLVWGGLEDLAQALHDAPEILPKLRVYWIGGPNKKWSPNAYQYLLTHHPKLWIIEANSAYRGWFTGGNQAGDWGNRAFVRAHIAGHGALGRFFEQQLGGTIKMGDSPSVGWLLAGLPEDPARPGWGGQFVRAWTRPYARFDRMTTPEDRIEIFGILELALPLPSTAAPHPEAWLVAENQTLRGEMPGDGAIHFRFCPKAAQTFAFTLRGSIAGLDGQTGGITAVDPAPGVTRPDPNLPHWWTDHPDPQFSEAGHAGIKTVNRWREAFLQNFADRIKRCDPPAPSE